MTHKLLLFVGFNAVIIKPKMEHGIVGIIGAILGGVLTKSLDYFLKRHDRNFEDATQLREELRLEIDVLRLQMSKHQKMLDEWKEKYYTILSENLELKQTCTKLQSEINVLRLRMDKA